MPTSPFRPAALAFLLGALAVGCGKRDREEVSAPPDPAPATPPVKARPAPDPVAPKPPEPERPEPKPPEPKPPEPKPKAGPKDPELKPIVFRGPGVRAHDFDKTKPTADAEPRPDAKVPTLNETDGRSLGLPQSMHPIIDVAALPDGTLVVARRDKLLIWDPAAGAEVADLTLKNVGLRKVRPSRDGRYMVALGHTLNTPVVAAFDLRERKVLWQRNDWAGWVHRVSTSLDGKQVYVNQWPKGPSEPAPGVIAYNTLTGAEQFRSKEHGFPRTWIAYPDNTHVVVADDDRDPNPEAPPTPARLLLVDGKTQQTREAASVHWPSGHWGTTGVVFSPSGRQTVWFNRRRALVLDAETFALRHDIDVSDSDGMVFSPDDRFLAWRNALEDGFGAVYLFDLAAGKTVLTVKESKNAPIVPVAFTADGKALLVGIADQLYRYDLPAKK